VERKELEVIMTELDQKVGEILALVIAPDRILTASNLLTRYTIEITAKLKSGMDEESIKVVYNPFINNVMSIVETLGVSSTQYKSVRRLILNELYDCRNNRIIPLLVKK
jgi:hypothetical protein